MPAQEVIQICRTEDGITVLDCRLVPADGLIGTRLTVSEAIPVIIAMVGLWGLAWGIKQISRMIQRS